MAYIGALSGSQNQGANSLWGSSTSISGGISGLASGINTDSIVQGLMQAAQIPLVSLLQQRQVLQWQQEQYQKVNNSLTALQNSVQTLRMQSTFMTQTASSTDSSIITASASTTAPAGSYQVTVSQLAQGATVSSGKTLSTSSSYGNTTLATLNSSATSYDVTINGEQIALSGTDTINTMLAKISADSKTGVSAFYDSNTGKVVMQTTATGTGATINISQDDANLFQGSFGIQPAASQTWTYTPTPATANGGIMEVDGVKVQLQASDMTSSSTVATAINTQLANAGSKISVTSPTSGSIVFTSTDTTLFSPVSINDPQGILTGTAASGAASDAVYTVNGYQSTSATNQFTYNGVTMNLTGLTGSSPATITVAKNVDSIVNSVMDFVKQYNTTVQYMQALYNQKPNLDYKPLTAQQESQMTSKQVDEWNQKAQTGLLANDMLVGDAMDGLMGASGGTVSGQPQVLMNGTQTTLNSLSTVGIQFIDPINGVDTNYQAPNVTTTGYNSFGLLEINTDTLTQAIAANPDAVMNLFTNNPAASGGSSTASNTGIAVQMYNSLTDSISRIQTQAGLSALQPPTDVADPTTDILPSSGIDPNGDLNTLFSPDGSDLSSIGQSISDLDSRALDMQSQLSDLQTRYQTEFSGMESALANMNSMSSAFMSMTGGSSSGG